MAKYVSVGGGNFVKWTVVGERIDGVLVGVVTRPNKFRGAGATDPVAVIRKADGNQVSVRIVQDALVQNWNAAQPKPGERVILVFEKVYPTGHGNPGKDISVELPDRDGVPAPVAPVAPPVPVAAGYDAIAAALRAKLGAPADTIIQMLLQMHGTEPAKTQKLAEAARSYGVSV